MNMSKHAAIAISGLVLAGATALSMGAATAETMSAPQHGCWKKCSKKHDDNTHNGGGGGGGGGNYNPFQPNQPFVPFIDEL